jgi:hypothetical protein
MTIKTAVQVARSARAHGFRYVQSSNVAVVSVTGERDAPNTPLKTVMQACAKRFEVILRGWLRTLSQYRLLLFSATPFAQHNALSRRRGIWGTEGLTWLGDAAKRSPCVEIASKAGERFAGLVEVGDANIFEATDFVRMHGGSALLVSRHGELTEERVRAMVAKLFPKGEAAVNWAGFVDQVGEAGDICVRASGGFDDREVSIDAFLSADLLQSLGLHDGSPP